MALVYKDRVKQTSTTTGTGTYDLDGSVAGFQGFVAAIGDANTCYYCATDDTDWEIGVGTVTDAATDTLSRDVIIASSNAGAAVNWTAGPSIFCTASAQTIRQSHLYTVAQAVTTSDVQASVGMMYALDISGITTSDKDFILPATANVGDRVGVMISTGDNAYELDLHTPSGSSDNINGINSSVGTASWSRLFITGETVIFRCVDAAGPHWIVEYDGRIPQQAMLYLSTNAASEPAATIVLPTSYSGVWSTLYDNASLNTTGTGRHTVRRNGRYTLKGSAYPTTTIASGDEYNTYIGINGAITLPVYGMGYRGSTSSAQQSSLIVVDASLNNGDYMQLAYRSTAGSKGCLAISSSRTYTYTSITEIL